MTLLMSVALGIFEDKVKKISFIDLKSLVTTYNSDYDRKMIEKSSPRQETPWGFQEISLENKIEHNISSIEAYKVLIRKNTKNSKWKDNKVHIINFLKGTYPIAKGNSYTILMVPSQTIIQGAGIGNTIFKVVDEIYKNDKFHFRRLFNLEYATHDVVVRGISFYNETKDNKWGLFHANGGRDRENYLFENIEFDDVFGAIGKSSHLSNFITFRGLKKRIGNTTKRIKSNFQIPIPIRYQFYSDNQDNVALSGQLGIRQGNSVVVHDCVLGDNISATIDIYANYVEVVGVKFINPLHDHAIKAPNGNHLYLHDSSFELNYKMKLMEGSAYWNPTFFTHEVTEGKEVSLRKNYHFKNLTFIRKYKKISLMKHNIKVDFIESEPFTIYDEEKMRKNNVSGDMVWENIFFKGYSPKHQIVGYPNVQTKEGYDALNYTSFIAKSAQMKSNNSYGSYSVEVQQKMRSSKRDKTGVYSWGMDGSHTIDYPRDNRLFRGSKLKSNEKPYILMNVSTTKNSYLNKIKH
jgi:hypothetical protein